MPSIKLTYFPLPGRAEAIRLCFTYADIPFEDKRVKPDEWGPMKQAVATDDAPLFKLASLPWLEVDGEEISQSLAITRYAAAISGLEGKTSLQKAKVDMVVSSSAELMDAVGKMFTAPEDKAEEVMIASMKSFKKILDPLEKLLKENNGGATWIVGDSVTVADFAVYAYFVQVDLLFAKQGKQAATEFDLPSLLALKQRVAELPKLQDYIAKSNEIVKTFFEQIKK